MTTYFGFSDECGKYKKTRNKSFLDAHPFYIRTVLIIEAREWKSFNKNLSALKKEINISDEKEIKWSYVWSIRTHQKSQKSISDDKPYKFLENIDYHLLIEFLEKSLGLLNELNYCKIAISVTNNNTIGKYVEKDVLKMHLQEIMQRFQMQINFSEENLGILFLDPTSKSDDDFLRDSYYSFFSKGDFFNKYDHIKDNISFENSHQSSGIQMADYISGSFYAFLRSMEKEGYERLCKAFLNSVYPHVIKSNDQNPMGYGIREVPRSDNFRRKIKESLENMGQKIL